MTEPARTRAPRLRRGAARALIGTLACLIAAGSGLAARARFAQPAFPHERHAGLFPLCTTCHAGIETGAELRFPEPQRCRTCHDGDRLEPVDYEAAQPRPSNLRFRHDRHARALAAAGESVGCERCHQRAESSDRMAVAQPAPERCLACHASATTTHLGAETQCSLCHVPLAESDLPAERVALLPQPPEHGSAGFLADHAPAADAASCAVCHARESCERCHRNAATVPAIAALPRDARVATLAAGRTPEYPLPAAHRARDWGRDHARAASGTAAGCANCHTRTDCAACHGPTTDERVASLPAGMEGAGADLPPTVRRVHDAGFAARHGAAAATSESCAACHDRSFCADCHDAPGGGYHAENFLERHAPEAYGSASECAACHTAETFCRGCHQGSGLAADARTQIVYHDTRSLWLLGHGQAARQALETCAGCHAQNDCTRCHAATGGWRISPHGPGFDPGRLESRNALMCARCHRRGGTGG